MPTNVLFDPGKFEHLTHLSYEDIGEGFFTEGRSLFYHVPSTINMLLTIRDQQTQLTSLQTLLCALYIYIFNDIMSCKVIAQSSEKRSGGYIYLLEPSMK